MANEMKTYSIFDVSDWFLSKSEMTHKKLQKLSYYFVAWGNALYNINLVNDTEFEAWVHGPVSPVLYERYKGSGWVDIPQKADNNTVFDDKAMDLLESVWITYGDKSANELEVLTHLEEPWKNARKGLGEFEPSNKVISNADMRTYYSSIYIGD